MENFHAGQDQSFHAGNFHAGQHDNFHSGNFHAGHDKNFHAGQDIEAKPSNFHPGNFHAGNFHAGQDDNFHAGSDIKDETVNFHAGNFHAGNFHAGQDAVYKAGNFHAGNFHAGNFHAGNFHAGQDDNLHTGQNIETTAGNFHAGNFHAGQDGSFHAGQHIASVTNNFHAGNFHAGQGKGSCANNFHAGQDDNFHAGQDKSFHAGDFHSGNFHAGQTRSFHAGNFHAGQVKSFHAGNFHAGPESNFHAGNFHAGRYNNVCSDNISILSDSEKLSHTMGTNWHIGEVHRTFVKSKQPGDNTAPVEFPIVNTTARFFTKCSTTETPFNYVERPTDGRFNNLESEIGHLQIRDIAAQRDQFELAVHGFSCISGAFDHIQGIHDYANPFVVESDFYPHIEMLLLRHVPGAQKVVLFDHTVRIKGGDRAPVTQAHIDQTPASARSRVWRHLPPAVADKVTNEKTRVRLINVWIPINGKVESNPLAFADSRTVADMDLVAVEHRYPSWTGETFVVKKNENQRWYMWSEMEDGDALLLCCYDSAGTGARCAHAAVKDPREIENAKARESIEIRALVFG